MEESVVEPLRALIVDDDRAFTKIVTIRLRAWSEGIDISTAGSLAAARELLDKEHDSFNLVILDTHLPDGMGFELIEHPALKFSAVLSVSSDDSAEVPAANVRAGAKHFLGKRQVTTALFIPLVKAILERKKLERQLQEAEVREAKIGTIKTLLATLRHEINNPLGAVLGGAYLLKNQGELAEDQVKSLKLIESSGNRIKQVVEQLCEAAELEQVTKANEQVFQIPGDAPWPTKDEIVAKAKDEKKS